MVELFPKEVKFACPDGGLFIWCELPKSLKSRDILLQCIEKKVAFVPGEPFFTSEGNSNYFRLNYSYNDEETIKEGIKRIAEVLHSNL